MARVPPEKLALVSCAQNQFEAARIIARVLTNQKTAPKVTFIGICARKARVLRNDVSFVPPTCWSQRALSKPAHDENRFALVAAFTRSQTRSR